MTAGTTGARPAIFRGALLADGQDHHGGAADLLVIDGRIAAIGPPGMDAPEAAETVDATDRLIVPGLVNAHTHSHLAVAKGLSEAWTLELHLHNGPWTGGGQALEDRRLLAQVSAVEMLLKGCTAAYDLVLEMPALDLQRAHRIGDLASTYQGTLLVAYAFASRQTLRALRLRNVLALTLPVQPDVVFALLANMQHFLPSSDAVGEMRFSDGQLARIAALSPSIQCECPNHIARLLLEISAFERYCAQCEDTDPGERALHEHLGRVTARARGLFEEALVAVAEADGLDLR
jgi:hypothetical protein